MATTVAFTSPEIMSGFGHPGLQNLRPDEAYIRAYAHQLRVARIVVDHWKRVARHRLAKVRQRQEHSSLFLAAVHRRTVLLKKVIT